MPENPNRAEVARRVEKAEKLLQKGKTADALAEYLQILEGDPQNDNVRQMAADLCLSLNKGAQAVRLLGELFERQVAATDATRASLTYKKLARYANPTWEQKVRFGQLLEHSNKKLAIGTYENALEDLQRQGKKEEALLVLRRIVSLEPSQANHLRMAELSAELGEHVMASQSFLQLAELAETAGRKRQPVVRTGLHGESDGFEDRGGLWQEPAVAGRGGGGDFYFRAAGASRRCIAGAARPVCAGAAVRGSVRGQRAADLADVRAEPGAHAPGGEPDRKDDRFRTGCGGGGAGAEAGSFPAAARGTAIVHHHDAGTVGIAPSVGGNAGISGGAVQRVEPRNGLRAGAAEAV